MSQTSSMLASGEQSSIHGHTIPSMIERDTSGYSPDRPDTVVSGFSVNKSSATKPYDIAKCAETAGLHKPNGGGEESPELLATSVGNEIGGNLIPSSSNISLLSLNSDAPHSPGPTSIDGWHSNVQRTLNQQRYPTGAFTTQHTSSNRSPTPLSGPTFAQQKSPTQKIARTGLVQQLAVQSPTSGSPSQLPPKGADSPSFGPVSASGSPSCYYLTDLSPPSSQPSSYVNMSSLSNLPPPRMIRPNSRLHLRAASGVKYKDSRSNSISNSIGGKSPEFLPVSSTLPSMTPLNLSISTESKEAKAENVIESDNEDANNGSEGNAQEDGDHTRDDREDRDEQDEQDVFGESIEG